MAHRDAIMVPVAAADLLDSALTALRLNVLLLLHRELGMKIKVVMILLEEKVKCVPHQPHQPHQLPQPALAQHLQQLSQPELVALKT